MESSFNHIICPFETEWKSHKADLMDKKNEYLNGKYFYAYNILGLRYFIEIRFKKRDQGNVWIYLYLDGLEERKIVANYTVFIESANYSKDLHFVYEYYSGWGAPFYTTSEFFESKSKFFVDGEITIKLKGTLKTQRPKISKISYPISMQWKIKEADLKAIMEESDDEYLSSEEKSIPTFSDVKYSLFIYPNNTNNGSEPKTKLFLEVLLGNESNIEAMLDFSVNSVKLEHGTKCVFDGPWGWGIPLCSTEDLFDPTKKFIIDGFLTVKLNGILMVERNRFITLNCKNGVAPKSAYKSHDKDFTIIIGQKEIRVHKYVLMDASPVLTEIFESGMKESIENKMILEEFEFQIVDIAIKLLYGISILTKFSLELLLSLYRLGDKYRISLIMDLIVEYLIKEISPSTVVYLIKFSSPDSFNIIKVYQKCIDFMIKCSKESTPVYASESLNDKLLATMVLNTFLSKF